MRYLIPDHLGSTSVVTDAAGAVIERQAYDAWGDRRTASGADAGAADPSHLIQPTSTDRGYTGHERLDQGNMGLIHMNGRVYDPTLARFISADPNVPGAFSTQKFNRFSYVSNSPLNATDPSGYLEEDMSAGSSTGVATALSGVTVIWDSKCGCDPSWGANSTSATARTMSTPGPENSSTPAGNGSGFSTAATDKGGPGAGTMEATQGGDGAVGSGLKVAREFVSGWAVAAGLKSPLDYSAETVGSDGYGLAKSVHGWINAVVVEPLKLVGFGGDSPAGALAGGGLGLIAAKGVGAAEQGGLNLFKWAKDSTTKSGGWKDGDFMLHLPGKGSAQADWAQNAGRLREQMRQGKPIFDSYRDVVTGKQIPTEGFLRAERSLLETRGWQYNSSTGAYHPPSP